jgi:hypothetical protein
MGFIKRLEAFLDQQQVAYNALAKATVMLSGQVSADRALPAAHRQLDEVLRLLVNRLAERQTAQFSSLPGVEFEEKVPVVSIDCFSYPLTPPLQILNRAGRPLRALANDFA